MSDEVLLEVKEGVAEVILNRPLEKMRSPDRWGKGWRRS